MENFLDYAKFLNFSNFCNMDDRVIETWIFYDLIFSFILSVYYEVVFKERNFCRSIVNIISLIESNDWL